MGVLWPTCRASTNRVKRFTDGSNLGASDAEKNLVWRNWLFGRTQQSLSRETFQTRCWTPKVHAPRDRPVQRVSAREPMSHDRLPAMRSQRLAAAAGKRSRRVARPTQRALPSHWQRPFWKALPRASCAISDVAFATRRKACPAMPAGGVAGRIRSGAYRQAPAPRIRWGVV